MNTINVCIYLYVINHLKDQHNQNDLLFSSIASSKSSLNMSQTAKFLSLASCNCGSCSEEGAEVYDLKKDEMTSNVDRFEYANRSIPQTERVLMQTPAAGHSGTALLPAGCRKVQCWCKPAHYSPVRACLTLHTMYKSIPEVRGKCQTELGKFRHGDCQLLQTSTPSHKQHQRVDLQCLPNSCKLFQSIPAFMGYNDQDF